MCHINNRIVHVTSVHPSGDARVLHKQCCSIASAGYDVHLVVAGEEDREYCGVKIHSVSKPSNRLFRAIVTTVQVAKKAVSLKPSIIQFHDPELIPVMLLLRAMRYKIVYDIHEDYVTSISQKEYLLRPLAIVAGKIFGAFEQLASRAFKCLLAEKYYSERFPKGIHVLNYPLREILPADDKQNIIPDSIRVLYTGFHYLDRGGHNHANIVNMIPDAEVYMVGRCSRSWAEHLYEIVYDNKERLHLTGVGHHVPFTEIMDRYISGNWTAGLAVFPPKEHHKRKELTKFYEYMAAGIPVICSNFPVWKNLIEGIGAGITVDPKDPDELADAINYLHENPELAAEMGRKGRQAVMDKYLWEFEAEKLLEVYKNM